MSLKNYTCCVSYTFVCLLLLLFLISFPFLFHSDKRLYSTSGGEVLFTKLDQEAEMDIKVTTTTTKKKSGRAASY